MKTIILAGGWGTRMGQLTELVPKPMVYIGNRPVLWHIMKTYSYYGYNDFIIALGVKGHIIKEYFHNFESQNNDFTIDLNTGNTLLLELLLMHNFQNQVVQQVLDISSLFLHVHL